MAQRYLVKSGNWSDPSVWSSTNGGAGGAGVPTISDTVYIWSNHTVNVDTVAYAYFIQNDAGRLNLNNNKIVLYTSLITNGGIFDFSGGTVEIGGVYSGASQPTSGSFRIGGTATSSTVIPGNSLIKIFVPSYSSYSLISTTNNIAVSLNNLEIISSSPVAQSPLTINGTFQINYLKIDSSGANNSKILFGGGVSLRKLVIYPQSTSYKIPLTSLSSGTTSKIDVISNNSTTSLKKLSIKDINISGTGKYYAGSDSVDNGGNSGWIFSDSPKLSTAVDAFAGQSINTTKWTSGIYISQNNGWIGTNSFGSTRSGDLKYREQFDAEGSHLKFKQIVGAGSTIKAYFANAQEQYGVTARRNIPDIYAEITDNTVKLILKAHTTYTSSSLTNNKLFYKIREQAGTIYLDGSDNGIEYTNLDSVVAADYGLDTVQLTGMPLFSFTSTGVSYASIGEMNTELEPTAGFISDVVSGDNPLPVQFTDQSNFSPTSWSWSFGDGTTSTVQNPLKTYALPGTYTVTLTASKTGTSRTITKTNYITVTPKVITGTISGQLKLTGGNVTQKAYAVGSAGGSIMLTGSVRGVVIQDASRIEKKTYLYKVYDPDGNYIETWQDVIDEPQFTEEINSLGSSMTIELARNSDSVGQIVAPLQTEAGQNITAEDGAVLYATTESRNQVGSGSSVDYNNRVDIYVFYGFTEPLMTESGEIIYTEDGEPLLVAMGAPNGQRIFTGFISGLNSRYGDTETTVVQLSSYGWDLGQFPIMSGANTTVSYLSKDPSFIAKDLTDKFVAQSSGYGTYTKREEGSISDTGTTVSYTFRANTYSEGLSKTVELMPSNWYYRVGLGDNTVYFKERASTPQHLFLLGKHIKSLELAGSILDSVNDVLFTGGGDPALYIRRTEAPAARTRRRLVNLSDNRVTVLESAEIIADNQIGNANKQLYRTTVTILSEVYDIESINIGDVVGFRNFDNYVDGLTMQIVGRSYTPDAVTLQLESMPLSVNKRLEDIRKNLSVQENQNAPNSPS